MQALPASAIAWLDFFNAGPNLCFPKPEFQVWACMSVWLPPPPLCAPGGSRGAVLLQVQDSVHRGGHWHTQTCVCHSLSRGH
eukprot:1198414-Rhodomonas_salina.4